MMFREGKEEEYSQVAYVATASEASESDEPASSAEGASGKKENKQLLTREKLPTVKNDKLHQQLAPITPIRKWCSLDIDMPYLFRRVVAVEVDRKSVAGSSANRELRHYAELGTFEEPLINVWLSPIMVKQSENYCLGMEDVYIIPLGKRVIRDNIREYHAFVIVPGNELVF